MKQSRRMLQVATIIREKLTWLFKKKFADHAFHAVTITHVRLSVDLKHSYIFFTLLEDNEENITLALTTLKNFQKQIRYTLAKNTSLRHTPQLHFAYDRSAQQADTITNLIEQLT